MNIKEQIENETRIKTFFEKTLAFISGLESQINILEEKLKILEMLEEDYDYENVKLVLGIIKSQLIKLKSKLSHFAFTLSFENEAIQTVLDEVFIHQKNIESISDEIKELKSISNKISYK